MLPLLLLPLLPLAWGHGGMVWPPIWQDGQGTSLEDRRDIFAFSDPVVKDPSSGRNIRSAKTWLTDQAYTGGHGDHFKGVGPVTNDNNKKLPKRDRCRGPCVADRQPWAAPGQAPSLGGGCGVFGGNPYGCPAYQDLRPPGSQCGQNPPAGRGKRGTSSFGSDARLVAFPQMLTTTWTLGSEQEVAWTSRGSHRGGYTYRLCRLPAAGRTAITEECFARNVLKFATNFTMIRSNKGEKVSEWRRFEQTDLSEGTYPPGSTWRPVGMVDNAPNLMRKDVVEVPASLPAGEYVLGWRWDGSGGHQVWVSCASVRLVHPAAARAGEEDGEDEDGDAVYTDEEYEELFDEEFNDRAEDMADVDDAVYTDEEYEELFDEEFNDQ